MKLKRIEAEYWWQLTKWELLEDYVLLGWIIPAGFRSDGLTIPLGLRWLFQPTGKGFEAGILHDYMLAQRKTSGNTRAYIATVFKKALVRLYTHRHIITVLYTGVRMYDCYIAAKEIVSKTWGNNHGS